MKKYEYREPEFNVVMTAQQDVFTASDESLLGTVTDAWDTISHGGGISFGL